MTVEEIKSDTLTLLLSNAINRNKDIRKRSAAIRKCAKVICQRTKDKPLKNVCRAIRNEKNDFLVASCIEKAEIKYFMEYQR